MELDAPIRPFGRKPVLLVPSPRRERHPHALLYTHMKYLVVAAVWRHGVLNLTQRRHCNVGILQLLCQPAPLHGLFGSPNLMKVTQESPCLEMACRPSHHLLQTLATCQQALVDPLLLATTFGDIRRLAKFSGTLDNRQTARSGGAVGVRTSGSQAGGASGPSLRGNGVGFSTLTTEWNLRNPRHRTIQPAWLDFRRQQREAISKEHARIRAGMHNACEDLRKALWKLVLNDCMA